MAELRDSSTLFGARLCRFSCLSVLAAEAFDASGGVHQLLFAGEKWVAVRADFQVDVTLMGRSRGKCVPASAHYAHVVVSGMNLFFHLSPSFGSPGHTEPLREFSGRLYSKGILADSANRGEHGGRGESIVTVAYLCAEWIQKSNIQV